MTPGDRAALALLVAGLGTSAALIAKGHDPVSTCIRRNRVAKGVVVYLTMHLCLEFRWDLLTLAGEAVASRTRRATLLENGSMLEIDLSPATPSNGV